MQFDTPAVLQDGYAYIPLNGYMEALGIQTFVDASTNTITGKKNNVTFSFALDNIHAQKNGEAVTLEAPPKFIDGTIMVPLRFAAESAGAVVGWSKEIPAVTLTMPSSEVPQLTHSVVTIYTNHTQGSGIILSADGLIATNFHVIQGQNQAVIAFSDGQMYNGIITIVGADVSSDIVILKIDKNDLKPVAYGRPSNELGMETAVIAIGTPNGQKNTVSYGQITSIHNQIISSTAPIDIGSSGGALFDSNGMLIGMTSLFSKESYFAIPVEKIRAVPLTLRLPLEHSNTIPIPLLPPKNITYKADGDKIQVSWEPLTGIDYFRVYLSTKPNAEYSKIDFPKTDSDKWYWDYPYAFEISTTRRDALYIKVSSVRDGVEPALSQPVKIK